MLWFQQDLDQFLFGDSSSTGQWFYDHKEDSVITSAVRRFIKILLNTIEIDVEELREIVTAIDYQSVLEHKISGTPLRLISSLDVLISKYNPQLTPEPISECIIDIPEVQPTIQCEARAQLDKDLGNRDDPHTIYDNVTIPLVICAPPASGKSVYVQSMTEHYQIRDVENIYDNKQYCNTLATSIPSIAKKSKSCIYIVPSYNAFHKRLKYISNYSKQQLDLWYNDYCTSATKIKEHLGNNAFVIQSDDDVFQIIDRIDPSLCGRYLKVRLKRLQEANLRRYSSLLTENEVSVFPSLW
jgi:hypothetical protein